MIDIEHLSKKSKTLWDELTTDHESPGRLALLLTGLEALDRADEAKAIIDSEGLTIVTESTGMARAHPLLKVEKDSRAQFVKVMISLGLFQYLYPPKDPWDMS